MVTPFLAALLAFTAAPVPALPGVQNATIQPSTDSASERQAMRALSLCLAQRRPGWARQTLAHGYLSSAQASAAAAALTGRDNCIKDDMEITFRTSGLVAGLAEHFLRTELARVDFAKVAYAVAAIDPRNVSEDFALCVAARNPTAARDLALSDPGSPAEEDAVQRLAVHIAPCTNPGESPMVELQSLRALVSVALYRGLTRAMAS